MIVDRRHELDRRNLTPKLAFRLQTIGRDVPGDERFQIFYSTDSVPDNASMWVKEVASLPTEPRRRINMGLSSLVRGGYRAVGQFRNASDIDLLLVRGLGREGIVFFQYVFGRAGAR